MFINCNLLKNNVKNLLLKKTIIEPRFFKKALKKNYSWKSLGTQHWSQDWKRLVFIPVPKKGNATECSNCHAIVLISHAGKVMLKILQAILPQYVNWDLPDVQTELWRGRGTREQIANICWIMEKAKAFWKNIYFCFIDYNKPCDCVNHNKLWKILKEVGMRPCYLSPEKPICRSRSNS